LRLFADEAVDRQIVESLRSAGIDVSYAAETDAAAIDEVVLQKATAESRLLVTST
jgi:post-segregation antitoxin (ccd killing protein)